MVRYFTDAGINSIKTAKRYQCFSCGYSTSRSDDLKKHIRIHTGERPFRCTFCTKTCNEKGALNKHMRIHTGERPFKCPKCDKTFAWSSNIKKTRDDSSFRMVFAQSFLNHHFNFDISS
ncbi:hypothetical protein CEXT_484521 [Caerostris extrusa]|uniref:C2H2-type domain-containing protein n=1 Tax=Caerostris extrusa TaxID=172846 RepID=A0AAV4Y522_CAEEX|nr:hypothetical protein CEXT_484521 [Caerostris extrusa]